MKKLILSAIALLIAASAFAQERNITVSITDTKGKPVKNLEAFTFMKGTKDLSMVDPDKTFIIEDADSNDIMSIILNGTIYDIPIGNAETVHVYLKNKRTFDGYAIDGGQKVTGNVNSYSADSEPWVRGAVDQATSYMYSNLADYIDARMPSLNVISGRMGLELSVNGNGRRPALIVVDGIEYPSFDIVNATYRPWQIKSIEVDRIGAIYGMRGSNGVVEITTNVME